jgi:uncharacterized protein YjiS (DUF1127 family)
MRDAGVAGKAVVLPLRTAARAAAGVPAAGAADRHGATDRHGAVPRAGRLVAAVRRAWVAWCRWQRARDDARALCALDDRTLRDLGLGRDEIGAISRGRGAPPRDQSSWIT